MMDPKYSLVIIKPLAIGRKHGPKILGEILRRCPVSMRLFREWNICSTTWRALYHDDDVAKRNINISKQSPDRMSWICLFTHIDKNLDPYMHLVEVCGPDLHDNHIVPSNTIRYKYRSLMRSDSRYDDVIHLSSPNRVDLEASLLFNDFRKDLIF